MKKTEYPRPQFQREDLRRGDKKWVQYGNGFTPP